jgi:predicted transcriptional regulator
MSATTIKVSSQTRDRVKALGLARHKSADAVIQEALDELDRRLFWDEFDAAAASEGKDDLRNESELFADTLKDGLSADE